MKELTVEVNGHSDVAVPFSRASKTMVVEAEKTLNAGEIAILNEKRKEVFTQVLEKYVKRIGFSELENEDARARGIRLVIHFLQRLDFEMLSHAKQMISCSRWGVCSSIMVQGGIGFLKAFAAIGASVSWDNTTRFGEDSWQKSKYFDVEFGRYATTPAVLILAGYKFVVHFDLEEEDSFSDFDSEYRMSSPLRIDGENTFGIGNRLVLNVPTLALGMTGVPFVLGMAGIPINAGMKYRTTTFRQRYDNAVQRACDWMLQSKHNLLGRPTLEPGYSNARADAVPDDIQ